MNSPLGSVGLRSYGRPSSSSLLRDRFSLLALGTSNLQLLNFIGNAALLVWDQAEDHYFTIQDTATV